VGVGLGGALPNLVALVTEAAAGRFHNASVGVTYVGLPFGGTIASVLVLLVPADHWRWVFVAGGLAPLALAPIMAWLLPPTPPPAARREADARLSAIFADGRLPKTLVLWGGFLLTAVALHLMLNWLPLLLQARGLSKDQAALAQVGFNAAGALAALGAGPLLDTRWRRPLIVACIVLLPLTLVFLGQAPAEGPLMAGLAVLLGAALLPTQVVIYAAAGGLYPSAVRGAGVGASLGWARFGALLGPTVAAAMLGAGKSPGEVLTGLLPIAIACGVCVAVAGWRPSAANLD
jgi:AAHS family 3-hydroxyphenylpropionic acid transporter